MFSKKKSKEKYNIDITVCVNPHDGDDPRATVKSRRAAVAAESRAVFTPVMSWCRDVF